MIFKRPAFAANATRLFLLFNALFGAIQASAASDDRPEIAFNPRDYLQNERNVICPAVDRTSPDGDKISIININYVDIPADENASEHLPLLMVHGWPGLWSTWARQISHFQSRYRLLVPNLRGFYKSTHPGDVRSAGTYSDFVSDLDCILANAQVPRAICVGHDWGAQLCFEAARQRPDRFVAVVGIVVPYLPAVGPFVPTAHLAKLAPKLGYQAYFSNSPEDAASELNEDVRRALRAILRPVSSPPPPEFLTSTSSLWETYPDKELPPIEFLSEEEEDYLVDAYERQGFDLTLQFYNDGNRQRSHSFAVDQGNHTMHTPSLLILPTHDRVADWRKLLPFLQTEKFMTNLIIKDVYAAHWPQLEAPNETNALMDEFLENLALSADGANDHTHEEL